MSLWKLRVGVESYYLAQIASGLDEYYTGAGEAPGVWTGTGSALLDLDGQVAGDDLRAVLAGLAPGTGLTPNGGEVVSHPRRVPGYDLTFSVPKSVSVLWALADPLVQAEVTAGCEAAMNESLAWLEREACFVRRGTNNRELVRDPADFGTRRMVAEGFVAAQFPHRTSRLGDPHLHWHVLVANMARGIDNRWTALDGTALFAAKRSVGVLFQTAMRRELTARLGIEWGPIHNDSAEIAGIPGRLLREFSRRHEQIAEWLDLTGQSGPDAERQALLETRTSKHALEDFRTLQTDWHERANSVGWGSTNVDELLAGAAGPSDEGERWVIPSWEWHPERPTRTEVEVTFEEWAEWLLTAFATEKTGTFDRFHLAQAVAAHAPAGASLERVERTVDRILASPAVVRVGDHDAERREMHAPDRTVADDRELLYTARSLLAVEQALVDELAVGIDAGVGLVPADVVEAVAARSTLGPDQAEALRVLTAGGDRVAVLVGRAGTGKTHTLGAVREAYEVVGWNVIGLAPSARAARELQDGSGIESVTIARHRVNRVEVDSQTLIVVDEAGMAGTRDLAALVDQATRSGAKVLLVGDHHQLPEVAAGGAFRAALDTLGDRTVELTVNRRQVNEWERTALDELRSGDVSRAFAAYLDHGRVVIADTIEDLHALVLGDWHHSWVAGHDTLLLSGTKAEARLLNRHARQILAANGLLDLTSEVEFAGRGFVVGDRVVLCRNDGHQHLVDGDPFSVDNGMRGTVTSVSPDLMTLVTTGGDHVALDHEYLERGLVDHAYAVVVHKAQGVTCDSVLLVGPAGLYREAGYVGMSRARHVSRVYATSAQAAETLEAHRDGIPLPTEPDPDPEAELRARLDTTGAKTLVLVDDREAPHIADLAANVPVPELAARARHAAHAELTCGLDSPATLRAALDAAVETREHVAVGRRARAVDRDNVGQVLSIDDHAGACVVHFESVDGRTAVKTLDWSDLVVIDHPAPVTLTPAATDTLARRQAAVERAEQAWADALAQRGVAPGDADRYRRATHAALDNAARQLCADRPEWLTTWLGPRPTTPAAAAVWDDATTRIAEYRANRDLPADTEGLGPRPTDPIVATEWHHLMVRTLEDRLWLTTHDRPEPLPRTALTPVQLIERQHELEQLLATAPADQRSFIDRIVTSRLDPTEMHGYLTSAMAVQDARREWILTNWPHLVELEQITTLITQQSPLAHWPAAQPAEVQEALDQLRALATTLDAREDRTLAEIDHAEAQADPVRQLEARRDHFQHLVDVASPTEAEAVRAELATITVELRDTRRARRVDTSFERYAPTTWDAARTTRVATLTHDVLSTQPAWVVDELRRQHDNGQLVTRDVRSLADELVARAITTDNGIEPVVTEPTGPQPTITVDVG
ncbi:MAG: MobF family relaxase [Ilumatobacteraceae bacterium]|nr:MobF family relaxase [Ilumatobacteraceae bacterium]